MKRSCRRILSFVLVLLMAVSIIPLSNVQAADTTVTGIVEVANKEMDGTLGGKYRKWFYGSDRQEAWCAIFVSWCANQAGVSTRVIPRTAGVGIMRTGVLNAGGHIVNNPQAGDLVFYWIKANQSWGHVGLMTGPKTSVQGNLGGKVLHVAKPEYYCLSNGSKEYTIEYIRPNYGVASIPVEDPPSFNVEVTTGMADTVTETSAILRGSFTITGNRASECGMYLGTDPNNLTKLGSDTVNTSGTSMFYSTAKYGRTLEPGTTYYYQGYAKVGNNIYWGQKKSFQAKGEQPIKPSISLTPQTVTIKDDREPLQLTVTTKPVGTAVTWSSSDKTVVYVYKETGKIVGLASGTAVVTAEMNYDGKRYQALCQVTVLPSVENPKVSLSDQNITIATDAYKVLSVTSSPNGEPISWMSSNPSVATVDESGRIYGVSAGNAVITATMRYNGASYSATCNVTVESPVEELIPPVLTLSSNRINEGEYVTAKWTAFSRNASYYIDYSGQINNGDVDFGMSGNTKALSMNFGANLKAGTYTVSLVASDSAGNARSNSVMLTVVPKGTTAVVVNTNGQYLAINDRPAASPNYSNQIGRIPPAGVVKVDLNKTSGNWYWVEYGGVSGYAYSKYLSLQ